MIALLGAIIRSTRSTGFNNNLPQRKVIINSYDRPSAGLNNNDRSLKLAILAFGQGPGLRPY